MTLVLSPPWYLMWEVQQPPMHPWAGVHILLVSACLQSAASMFPTFCSAHLFPFLGCSAMAQNFFSFFPEKFFVHEPHVTEFIAGFVAEVGS